MERREGSESIIRLVLSIVWVLIDKTFLFIYKDMFLLFSVFLTYMMSSNGYHVLTYLLSTQRVQSDRRLSSMTQYLFLLLMFSVFNKDA